MALLKRFGPLAILAIAFAVVILNGWHHYLSLETLRDYRDEIKAYCQEHHVVVFAAFFAGYVAAVALSVPGAGFFSIAAGFLFGLWAGVAIVVPAATLGATVIFLAARSALGDRLMARLGPFGARLEAGFKRDALSYMLILRLIPAVPFWALNVAGAAFGMKLRDYVVATAIGIIPGVFVYVSIGNGLDAAFDAGRNVSLSGLFAKPEILLPIVGLIILAVVPVLYKRLKGRGPIDGASRSATK